MIALGFTIGALIVGLVLYLPFFLWFRFRRPKDSALVAHDVEICLHMAFVTARKQRYETVTLEQLLLALLDNPRAADMLRGCTVDIDAMRASLAATVRDSTPVAPGTGPVDSAASPEFKRVLQHAITRVMTLRKSPGQRADSATAAILRKSARPPTVDGAELLAALMEEPAGAAVDELKRRGVTPLAIKSLIAHGETGTGPVAMAQADVADTATTAIVLQNDDFTPMEFVVEMLQQHLGLTLEAAVRLMLQVHHEGRAVAGQFPADVANEKAERLRAAASQAGHPFRCLVEAR